MGAGLPGAFELGGSAETGTRAVGAGLPALGAFGEPPAGALPLALGFAGAALGWAAAGVCGAAPPAAGLLCVFGVFAAGGVTGTAALAGAAAPATTGASAWNSTMSALKRGTSKRCRLLS